jgi:hypothetical protein
MGDVPNPEKGVLNAKFSLTKLPVLSDNDLARHKARRKKSKMADVETDVEATEESDGRGREKKYELDLTAQGVVVKDETLTKDQKSEDGKVIKTHTIVSKDITVADLNGALGLFGNDESKLFGFLSEAATAYFQRGDRQRLTALAKGPSKAIDRAVKAMTDYGIDEAAARKIVEDKFREQGLL